jgi:hypothetical protein
MEFNDRNESRFLTALAEDNQSEITSLFPDQEFVLIEVEDESEDNGEPDEERVTAMIAEVEDFSALILFTSPGLVESFAEQTDLFENEESIPRFIMTGRQIMELLPENTGLLFNPESPNCFVMSPKGFQSFRDEMME